jgi:hypothetical protein
MCFRPNRRIRRRSRWRRFPARDKDHRVDGVDDLDGVDDSPLPGPLLDVLDDRLDQPLLRPELVVDGGPCNVRYPRHLVHGGVRVAPASEQFTCRVDDPLARLLDGLGALPSWYCRGLILDSSRLFIRT